MTNGTKGAPRSRAGRKMLLRAVAIGTGAILAGCTNDVVGTEEPIGTAVQDSGNPDDAPVDNPVIGTRPVEAGPDDSSVPFDGPFVGTRPVEAGPDDSSVSNDGPFIGTRPVEAGPGNGDPDSSLLGTQVVDAGTEE